MSLLEFEPSEYKLDIHASDLSLATGTGEQLLDGISLSIHQGEFIAIHGPSGAGKSLFATALAGIRFNQSKQPGRLNRFVRSHLSKAALANGNTDSMHYDGTVRYDLVRLASGDQLELPADFNIRRRHIGFVPQEPILDSNRTARDNILSSARLKGIPIDEDLVQETMHQLGVDEFADKLASKLSGGQQKRVSIARALVGGPNALILDEPTADLNPEMKTETNLMLQRINDETDMTIISVTHEESLATRRIEMVKGQILSDTGLYK